MKLNKLLTIIGLLVSLAYSVQSLKVRSLGDGVNGGVGCATCTVLIALVEQLSIVNNNTIEASLFKFCNNFPAGLLRLTCQQAVDEYADVIING